MSLQADSPHAAPSAVEPPRPSAFARRALSRARSIEDLRRAAQRTLPRSVFDFIDGGAEDESTLRDNREAFRRVRFLPKTLVDVSKVDTTTAILDASSKLPIIIAPTGAAGFAWPCGDLAIARAAARFGIPFSLSTSASVSIEHVAAGANARLWFQSYIFKKRNFTAKLIERALASGYGALIITVDLPVGGNRERDFRNDFSIPFRYTPRNVLDFAMHPGWAMRMLRHGPPILANLRGFAASDDIATVASSVGRNYDASFHWDDLKVIRDSWPGKLIVKGIARPDDAEILVSIGCDAVVVSNHGGRQLDGAIATLDALPAIAAAVAGRAKVFLDGGIRRGSDVVKALALGADAVLIGRSTLYGAGVAGEDGAAHAIGILRDELVRCMQLCGVRRIEEIGAHILVPSRAGFAKIVGCGERR
jgi:(S)-mandelate dehydrogenase